MHLKRHQSIPISYVLDVENASISICMFSQMATYRTSLYAAHSNIIQCTQKYTSEHVLAVDVQKKSTCRYHCHLTTSMYVDINAWKVVLIVVISSRDGESLGIFSSCCQNSNSILFGALAVT